MGSERKAVVREVRVCMFVDAANVDHMLARHMRRPTLNSNVCLELLTTFHRIAKGELRSSKFYGRKCQQRVDQCSRHLQSPQPRSCEFQLKTHLKNVLFCTFIALFRKTTFV